MEGERVSFPAFVIAGKARSRRIKRIVVANSFLRNFVGIIAVEDLIVKLSVLSVWISSTFDYYSLELVSCWEGNIWMLQRLGKIYIRLRPGF